MIRRLPANAFTFAVIAVLVTAVWYLLKPAPPSRIVMSTGVEGGAYAKHGKRYAELLARDGVEVVLLPSSGAIQNLERLGQGEADVAFVQSGLATAEQRASLVSLGNLYFEPVWVIHRGERRLTTLLPLVGKRIGVGQRGSGTDALAHRMLALNGIWPSNTQLVNGDFRGLMAKLRQDELDAVFAVLAPDSPAFTEQVLLGGDLFVADFERALAYQRRLPELRRVTLPQGVLDLPRNLPPKEIQTVAAQATLVATEALHPAVKYLLWRAARTIHAEPDLMSDPGSFPTLAGYEEFEVPEHVRRLYTEGPPFLYQHLPYWLANLVYRMWLAAIAAFAIFITVTDWIPRLFRYVLNVRVGQKYLAARRLEDEIARSGTQEFDRISRRLEALKREAQALKMPMLLDPNRSELHQRLDQIEKLLKQRAGGGESGAGPA